MDVSAFGEVVGIRHLQADRSEVGVHKDILEFISTKGEILRIELSGECCDRSFFEAHSLDDANDLVGTSIRAIEKVQLQEKVQFQEKGEYKGWDDDYTTYHALIISADKLSITLDWRNESNGFYTGYAEIFLNGKHLK